MLGNRKPQSYYREIAWELRRDPYIAVRHPKVCHIPYHISGWGFYDCAHSWCCEGYEGTECEVYVFADCDRVTLELNGREVGSAKRNENGVYRFNLPYERGTLVACAYVGDEKIGQSQITTEGKAEKIALIKEKSYTGGEIVYVDAEVQDENGSLCTQAAMDVSYSVAGGKILGTISGNLTTDRLYNTSACATEKGKTLIVVKKTEKTATLTAKAEGFSVVSIEI